jgi:WD40 repeat protein
MNRDRGLVAVGLFDGNIEICEINSGGRVRGWKGHHRVASALVFASDGGLVSGSHDGSVKKWDEETGTEAWSRGAGVGPISCVCELADGRLVIGGVDGAVRVLDGVTGHEIMVCGGGTGDVCSVIFLGELNAGSFASGSEDEAVRVWASDGTLRRVLEVGVDVLSLSPSPGGRFVAAGCGEGFVRLYLLPDWDQVWSVTMQSDAVFALSWSPDGRFLASGSDDNMVKILSAGTGATLRTLKGHSSTVYSVLFSSDGTKVFSGSFDKTVRVWRLFWPTERRVRGMMEGLEVLEDDWEMREVCCEIVGRMKRLWEVETK